MSTYTRKQLYNEGVLKGISPNVDKARARFIDSILSKEQPKQEKKRKQDGSK